MSDKIPLKRGWSGYSLKSQHLSWWGRHDVRKVRWLCTVHPQSERRKYTRSVSLGWVLISCNTSKLESRKQTKVWWDIKTCPSDTLLSMMLHLLKILQPSKTTEPTEDQVFKHMCLWRLLNIQITMLPNFDTI